MILFQLMGDVYLVDLLKRLLHCLSLVQHVVVTKHHEDEQDAQIYSFHSYYNIAS